MREPIEGTVSSKYQLTIPAKLRVALGIKPGDKVRLVPDVPVAAHAGHHQLHVLTFDRTIYDAAFPRLLVKP